MTPIRRLIQLLVLATAAATLSCVVAVHGPAHDAEGAIYQEDLVYAEAPPAPRTEVILGTAPGPDYVWVGGYWTRHQSSWHWVQGRWVARPHAHAVWVAGRWDPRPHGFVWVAGRWN